MKKQNLIITVALAAIALTASAGFAADLDDALAFHPIADADFLGGELHNAPDNGRSIVLTPGPGSDAEWDDEFARAGDDGRSVELALDPIEDADFLSNTGTSVASTHR